MLVRCGRCRTELEIAGPGEFACPRCGTRNVVRGADPFGGVPDLGGSGGLAGVPPPPPPADDPAPGVSWIACPACSYRFAVGEVEQVSCPTCSAQITMRDGTPVVGDAS